MLFCEAIRGNGAPARFLTPLYTPALFPRTQIHCCWVITGATGEEQNSINLGPQPLRLFLGYLKDSLAAYPRALLAS